MAAIRACCLVVIFSEFVSQEVHGGITESPPPYFIADINSSVNFTFATTDKPDFFIAKYRDCKTEDTTLITDGECQTYPQDRFSCTANNTKKLYSFVIKGCLHEDAGTYVTRNNDGDITGDTAFTELVVLNYTTNIVGSNALVSWTVCGNATLNASCAGQTAKSTREISAMCKDYNFQLQKPQHTTNVTCSMTIAVSSKCTTTINTEHLNKTVTINASGIVLGPTAVYVLLPAFITVVTHLVAASC